MCVVSTVAGATAATLFADTMIAAVGRSVLGLYAQNEQASAARSAYNAEVRNANQAWQNSAVQENEALLAKKEDATDRAQKARIQTLQAKGTALASSQASGANIDALLADYDRSLGQYQSNLEMAMKQEQRQSYWNQQGHLANYQNRVNSAYNQAASVSGPNYLGTLLGLGGTALGAWGRFSTKDPVSGKYSLR